MSAPAPRDAAERNVLLDFLRGIALLGILLMNINGMGLPSAAYSNPAVHGLCSLEALSVDSIWWLFSFIFIDGKMRGLFSLLFGASTILLLARIPPPQQRRLWFRRMLTLLVFGLLHGHLLWYGEVLYHYSLCGMLLYFFRNSSTRTLLLNALLFLIVDFGIVQGGAFKFTSVVTELQHLQRIATPLSTDQSARRTTLKEAISDFSPSPQKIKEELLAGRGRLSAIKRNSDHATALESADFFFLFPDIMSMMLLGMALMRSGLLTGEHPNFPYRLIAITTITLGSAIAAWSGLRWMQQGFPFLSLFQYVWTTLSLTRLPLTLGYIALLTLLCQRHAASRFVTTIARVGRMALSNYIICSLLSMLAFSGFGLGLFGTLSRAQLLAVILPIWAIVILFTEYWLPRHRFGPLEGLWRKATYA
jgi:uncharacterized protein